MGKPIVQKSIRQSSVKYDGLRQKAAATAVAAREAAERQNEITSAVHRALAENEAAKEKAKNDRLTRIATIEVGLADLTISELAAKLKEQDLNLDSKQAIMNIIFKKATARLKEFDVSVKHRLTDEEIIALENAQEIIRSAGFSEAQLASVVQSLILQVTQLKQKQRSILNQIKYSAVVVCDALIAAFKAAVKAISSALRYVAIVTIFPAWLACRFINEKVSAMVEAISSALRYVAIVTIFPAWLACRFINEKVSAMIKAIGEFFKAVGAAIVASPVGQAFETASHKMDEINQALSEKFDEIRKAFNTSISNVLFRWAGAHADIADDAERNLSQRLLAKAERTPLPPGGPLLTRGYIHQIGNPADMAEAEKDLDLASLDPPAP